MKVKISNYVQSKNVFFTVLAGDSIENVASLFGVPRDYILKNNPGEIYPGKVLFLPETNFSSYVVRPFDTLQKVANMHGVSVEDICLKNNLQSDYIFVGQKLYV